MFNGSIYYVWYLHILHFLLCTSNKAQHVHIQNEFILTVWDHFFTRTNDWWSDYSKTTFLIENRELGRVVQICVNYGNFVSLNFCLISSKTFWAKWTTLQKVQIGLSKSGPWSNQVTGQESILCIVFFDFYHINICDLLWQNREQCGATNGWFYI